MITCPNPILLHFRFEVRIWIKIGNSNYWKVDQNRIWTRDHKFRKNVWTKIGYSKSAHHVKMNSFKHFTGPKKIPEYFFRYIIYIIYNPIYNIYHILNRDWIKLAFSVTWRFFSIPMWIKKWILLMSHLQITVT